MLTPIRATSVLLVLTALLYSPSLGYGYVYEDLNDFRKWSEMDTLEAWASWAWRKPARSLTALSYMAGQTLSGLEPWGFHLMSVAWHLLNGVLVAMLAASVVGGGWAVPLVAGVFLLHPVQVESVAYISAHADLVSTAAILLALLFAERRRLGLAFVACGLAVLGKETAVASFLLIPVWEVWRGRAVPKAWIACAVLPPLLLLDRFPITLDPAWMARTVTEAIGLLSLWIVPLPLTIDHDWSAMRIGIAALVMLALVIGNRPARFALASAAVLLAPRLFVPQLEGLHEHHLYNISIGLSLCAGLWLFGEHAQERSHVESRLSPLPV